MNDFGRLYKLIIVLLSGSSKSASNCKDKRLYDVWVCLNKDNGWVLSGSCTCMADLGSACSQIAALLFKLETAVRLKLRNSTAQTSVLCSWKSCKKAVEPSPLNPANFSTVKKRGLPGDNTKDLPHKITNYSTKNLSAEKFPLKSEDVQSLYKIGPQASFFTGIDLHDYDINSKNSSNTDAPSETEDNKFPEPLTSLFNPESKNFPQDKIKAEGEHRYQNYKETYSQND